MVFIVSLGRKLFRTSERRRKCPQINQHSTEQAPPPQPTKKRRKERAEQQNEVTPSRSSNQQPAGLRPSLHLPGFSSSDPPSPPPASAVSSDKSLPGCILPPLPSMSAPIGVFPSLPHSFLPRLCFCFISSSSTPPPLLAWASPAGLFGRLSSAATVSLTQPIFLFEMTQIFRLALVFLTVSSPPARAPVLLIIGFLLSAPPPSAANLRASSGGYFSSPSTISFVSPDHSQAGLACRRR